MKCPKIVDLPKPTVTKPGWPWTEESNKLPERMSDGSNWPRISIITPSMNQGRYIEETIRSVLLQGYPDLEYIVIDGGSTDETIEIIKKYDKWISYWVSEADKGQCNAINKGLDKSTGIITGWLNSDDVYCQDTFQFVATKMWSGGNYVNRFLYGNCIVIDEDSRELSRTYGKPNTYEDILKIWKGNYSVPQPGSFVAGDLLRQTPLNESLHYVLDWELFIRLSAKTTFRYENINLSKFRHHVQSKSISKWVLFIKEKRQVLERVYTSQNRLYIIPIRGLYISWVCSYYYHNFFLKKLKTLLRTLGLFNVLRQTREFIKRLL